MTAADLILPCRDCGKPIAIAKIGGVLAYGHLVNPQQFHHEAKPPAVRLARSGADRSSEAKTKARAGEPQLRSEGPDTLRGHAAAPGPSPTPRLRMGGSPRTIAPDAPSSAGTGPRRQAGKRAAHPSALGRST